MDIVCSDADCETEAYCKGLCTKHYARAYRAGILASMPGKIAPKGEPLRYLLKVVLKHRDEDNCLIWPYGKIEGYGVMRFKGKSRIVSRLVCRRINGKAPTKKHEACHSCGRGHEGCVNLHHLYWGTHAENMADTIIHGTSTKGAVAPIHKLPVAHVRKIRRLRERGWEYKRLADRFNVHVKTIAGICRYETWKNVR